MTPKERVLKTINHEEPDRVPTGEFCIDYPIFEAILGRKSFYRARFKELQAYWEGRRDEVVESQKKDIVDLTKALKLDLVPVQLVPSKYKEIEKPKQISSDTFKLKSGHILKYSPLTENLLIIDWQPPEEPTKTEEWSIDESQYELIHYVIKELGQTHFIFARVGTGQVSYGSVSSTNEYFRMLEDPKGFRESQERSAAWWVELVEKYFNIPGIDAAVVGGDYGYKTGPFISPKHWREFYFPALKAQCEALHKMGLKAILHSCGNNRLLMDQFIEAGVDVYQSIEPQENIADLKALYGDKITLWGGIATDTLGRGSQEEVKKEAEQAIKACAPGGGFILGASHSVAFGSKPENYLAALEVLKEKGHYPLKGFKS